MTEYEIRQYTVVGKTVIRNARIDVIESLRDAGYSESVIALIMNQPESTILSLTPDNYVNGYGPLPAKKKTGYIAYSTKQAPQEGKTYKDMLFSTLHDANTVLNNMKTIIYEYGFVSVADFYDLVGVTAHYEDNKVGWRNIDSAYPEMYNGGWKLILPEPKEEKK